MTRQTCAVEGCDTATSAKGYCNLHYQRWYRYGDPMASHKVTRQRCKVEDCDVFARRGGHCVKHARRFKSHGNPHTVLTGGRPIKGDQPGWHAAHKRIHRSKGSASLYPCIDCGVPAQEWSYNNLCADEMVDPDKGIRYSLDARFYEPRCVKCHRSFDAAERRHNPQQPARLVLTIRGGSDA